jgi:hypothetical protein
MTTGRPTAHAVGLRRRWRSVADVCEHWQARYQREGFGSDDARRRCWMEQ